MNSVFLSLIYLTFPITIYFIYRFYSKTVCEKEKTIFLDLSLISSFYLCMKFNKLSLFYLLMINIPLVIALYKKKMTSSFILIVSLSIYLSKNYDINAIYFCIYYLVIFVLTLKTKFNFVNIFIIVKILFDCLIVFVKKRYALGPEILIDLVIHESLMYILYYASVFVFAKIESIIKLYCSLEEITKEKTMYDSLFKITHEIKNPLAVCKGYLDMIDVKEDNKTNKYINIIEQEIERTLLLLKDFSNVSKLKIEKNMMDVSMLLDDVYDETNLLFRNGINLDYKQSDMEVYINADYDRLKQVLINVIKNAKESLNGNGKVSLQSKITKNNCVIIVTDNGSGMDKETLKNIGTPFFTTKNNGTGLGVCFSKEIIEKHDGTILYSSKVGKGTQVKIILPLK